MSGKLFMQILLLILIGSIIMSLTKMGMYKLKKGCKMMKPCPISQKR